jgi:ATP-dependent Lon protease
VAQQSNGKPFGIDSLRPIQMSKSDAVDTLARERDKFTTEEWVDLLIRSIGIEPSALNERAKRVVLLRMVPFVERNYNLVELGPRGTGKSHLFQQISPYAHLISGGKATVAKMFVNNATGQRGYPIAATSYCQSLAAFFTQLHISRAVIFGPEAIFRGVRWPLAKIFK